MIATPKRTRVIEQGDGCERDVNGRCISPARASLAATSAKTSETNRVIEVAFTDTMIILRVQGSEFKDMNDERTGVGPQRHRSRQEKNRSMIAPPTVRVRLSPSTKSGTAVPPRAAIGSAAREILPGPEGPSRFTRSI